MIEILAQTALRPFRLLTRDQPLLALVCLLLCLGCSSPTKTEFNLSKNQEIALVYSGSGHVHGLDLEMQGHGHGELELHEGDKKYTGWKLQGDFKESYHGDWYAAGGRLVWKPSPNQTQNQLQLNYQFRD
ncbi:MAG: hypothetical protein IV090_23515 [Candidatus Sericytochromatia bacterium]|nr:hypothetical protein [Candidatus Sericytochromatia bacterium]